MRPRDILNGLKWGSRDLKAARVTIIHRGAPSDRKVIEGKDILELGRGFMRVVSEGEEVEIPYHRIITIEVGGNVKYKKRGY
ncbi:MAG: RNA repair domain-containing protein [Candidatus Hadarchaeota archaeon]